MLDLRRLRVRVQARVVVGRVRPRPAADRGVGEAVDRVEGVVAVGADDRVHAGAARDRVVAALAAQRVVVAPAVERVVAVGAVEHVEAVATGQLVIAEAADDPVVLAAAMRDEAAREIGCGEVPRGHGVVAAAQVELDLDVRRREEGVLDDPVEREPEGARRHCRVVPRLGPDSDDPVGRVAEVRRDVVEGTARVIEHEPFVRSGRAADLHPVGVGRRRTAARGGDEAEPDLPGDDLERRARAGRDRCRHLARCGVVRAGLGSRSGRLRERDGRARRQDDEHASNATDAPPPRVRLRTLHRRAILALRGDAFRPPKV